MSDNAPAVAPAVIFTVPLPPRALRVNRSRGAHWASKHKAAGEYSAAVWWESHNVVTGISAAAWREYYDGIFAPKQWPWERAAVTFTWRYASVAPDIDNIAGSLKVLGDTLCCAPTKIDPKHRLKDRYFLGIVEDDGGIESTFKREKVTHRKDECVLVTIERIA